MRALLSVADRDGIVALARGLLDLGIDLVATDGTRSALADEGIEARSISDLTAMPPVMGGQVKTFHPQMYARHPRPAPRARGHAEPRRAGHRPIDVVVVNVRPFAPQVGRGVVPIDEAIEMIDVGGLALMTAAARNFAGVAVACDPADYPVLLGDLREHGLVTPETRRQMAAKAFALVAAYDAEVAAYLDHISGVRFPSSSPSSCEKERDLPYGENPHQSRRVLP